MNVAELMQQDVRTCAASDSLAVPAQIMWERDCGSVPVVGDGGELRGMITDRDICMAAYLRGKPLHECTVAEVMSRPAIASRPNDTLQKAEDTMRDNRIRRLPVVDENGHLTGILSLNDLALAARPGGPRPKDLGSETIASTLAAICQHRRSAQAA